MRSCHAWHEARAWTSTGVLLSTFLHACSSQPVLLLLPKPPLLPAAAEFALTCPSPFLFMSLRVVIPPPNRRREPPFPLQQPSLGGQGQGRGGRRRNRQPQGLRRHPGEPRARRPSPRRQPHRRRYIHEPVRLCTFHTSHGRRKRTWWLLSRTKSGRTGRHVCYGKEPRSAAGNPGALSDAHAPAFPLQTQAGM